MLYTDSDVVKTTDLIALDSEITDIGFKAKPPIAIDGDGSAIRSAWVESGDRLLADMQMFSIYLAQPGITGGHVAAVLNTGLPARTQPRVRLNQIVEYSPYGNSQSALKTWICYQALYIFYRNASNRFGIDRFQEKRDTYRKEADGFARSALRCGGLPMVYQPLEAPAAIHSFNPGAFGGTNCSDVAGGSNASPQSLLVAVTYYDSSRYVSQTSNGNAESGPSPLVGIVIPANRLLRVDITSLIPPAGAMDAVGTAQGTWSPLTATHWNLWAGLNERAMYLQKEGMPIATKAWSLTADPVATGTLMGQGQFPDVNITVQNIASRA